MNRLLESLFFLLQNYFVFIFFYVMTFVTYAQKSLSSCCLAIEKERKERIRNTWLPMKFLWRYSRRYKATHLDLMKQFWVVSLLVIISYFFFLGLREWNFTILLEKVTHYFAWNLFIVVGKRQKSVALSFSLGNQFRFDQFLFLSRPKNFILLFSSF